MYIYTYVHLYICTYIHVIYTHVFSQLLESKKWGKLTSFGVDGMKLRTTTLQILQNHVIYTCTYIHYIYIHVFSQLLESKKCVKIDYFWC